MCGKLELDWRKVCIQSKKIIIFKKTKYNTRRRYNLTLYNIHKVIIAIHGKEAKGVRKHVLLNCSKKSISKTDQLKSHKTYSSPKMWSSISEARVKRNQVRPWIGASKAYILYYWAF